MIPVASRQPVVNVDQLRVDAGRGESFALCRDVLPCCRDPCVPDLDSTYRFSVADWVPSACLYSCGLCTHTPHRPGAGGFWAEGGAVDDRLSGKAGVCQTVGMDSEEIPLVGGNTASFVTRAGETVWKPWVSSTNSTQRLIRHLREHVGDLVTEPRGRDDHARQVVKFVPCTEAIAELRLTMAGAKRV